MAGTGGLLYYCCYFKRRGEKAEKGKVGGQAAAKTVQPSKTETLPNQTTESESSSDDLGKQRAPCSHLHRSPQTPCCKIYSTLDRFGVWMIKLSSSYYAGFTLVGQGAERFQ